MIYKFKIVNDLGVEKIFYFDAENSNKLYRKILDTYRITRDKVTILEEYEDDGWGVKLKKSYEVVEDPMLKKATELYKSAGRKSDPYKTDYKNKYKLDEIAIDSISDIVPILNQYKVVKVYWDLGSKRGQHVYYCLFKNKKKRK